MFWGFWHLGPLFAANYWGCEGYWAGIIKFLWRVSDIIFSKCSNIGLLCLTQSFDIRHPWLRSHSLQRPVAELLGAYRTLRKSNILHKPHEFYYPSPISNLSLRVILYLTTHFLLLYSLLNCYFLLLYNLFNSLLIIKLYNFFVCVTCSFY